MSESYGHLQRTIGIAVTIGICAMIKQRLYQQRILRRRGSETGPGARPAPPRLGGRSRCTAGLFRTVGAGEAEINRSIGRLAIKRTIHQIKRGYRESARPAAAEAQQEI